MTKRKSFSPEFKREAVRLLETSQKSSADLGRELGVRRNQLYKWKEQLSQRGAGAFPGSGRGSGSNDEVGSTTQGVGAGQRGARHLKKGSRVLCQGAQVKYAFVRLILQSFESAGCAKC